MSKVVNKVKPGERLDRRLLFHVRPALARVVAEHLSQRRLSFSQWIRETLIAALRAEGCALPDDALTLPAHLQIDKRKSRHNASTEAEARAARRPPGDG
jgi:hypothetical protein